MRKITVEPNIIDKVVNYIDPVRARKRMQARVQMAIAGQWTGAARDRRATKDWSPIAGSADEDTLDDLPMLRTRSRDLERHNPIALGAINTNVTSIVATGLSLNALPDGKTLRMTSEQVQEWRDNTHRKFSVWANNAIECDIEGTLNFYEQQPLVLRSAYVSGDVFALLPIRRRPANVYGLKLQVVEADRVCNPHSVVDTETLVDGVEKDADGFPIAYHIMRSHPGSMIVKREWDKVPAFGELTGRRNVIHLYDKRRPGLTRGVPYLAPVIEMLKQISDYTHAELSAAVVAAMFTVFVKTESGTGLDLDANGEPQSSAAPSGSDIKLGAGAIIDLARNEDITIANPGRPNAAADVFLQAMLRQLGVALELPFEVLVKHFTASYTAARAALLEAWRFFRVRRAWLASRFCQPVYEAWLEEAVLLGDVYAPGFFESPAVRAAWCNAEWIGDSPGQIDPLKEVLAAEKRIELTISNHTIETMESRGSDWREINEQLAREREIQRANGTLPPSVIPQPAQSDEDNASTDLETA